MRKCFTVVELILVVGIMGALAAVSIVGGFQLLSQSYFTNTVERITRTLRTAQVYSFSGRGNAAWGVHYEIGGLTLFRGTEYATRDPSFDVPTDIPPTMAITGWSDLSFDRLRGTPSVPLSIVVEWQGRAGTISVNEQGEVTRP